jgi:hypothetical protein
MGIHHHQVGPLKPTHGTIEASGDQYVVFFFKHILGIRHRSINVYNCPYTVYKFADIHIYM